MAAVEPWIVPSLCRSHAMALRSDAVGRPNGCCPLVPPVRALIRSCNPPPFHSSPAPGLANAAVCYQCLLTGRRISAGWVHGSIHFDIWLGGCRWAGYW